MIAALILAGGQGLRLGGADKALVPLGGRALIGHLLGRLRPQVENIAISANGDAGRFADWRLPVLPDQVAGKGPLAGVLAGLVWAGDLGAEAMVSVPVDTPFIPDDLLARLRPGPSVACHRGRQHHLVAMWPVDAAYALARFLQPDGSYKVRDFLNLLRARQVSFNAAFDPFHNINTPEDLAVASARLDQRQPDSQAD